ncbi:hypothetical protein N5T62_02220 [Aliarcobacter cryaerophilus]|uniref:hypothetical protein n=1 Tax=Aliarcobacter cryaerophilus TaxID=28198 RepID=UPI0021B46622|nr:hypothetical protein [Aliarcobacter cryaerophilus]MCT7504900.1 hypothetical protein [Aliarcobacter cryaerophilus]
MKEIFSKTFGGLTPFYYFRNLFFGAIIFVVMISIFLNSNDENMTLGIGNLTFMILSTLLYPYSRFVYESIASFIIGNNTFFVNIGFMCRDANNLAISRIHTWPADAS